MTSILAFIDFKEDPPKSGVAKVLFRSQPEHLAKIDRAATILCMSREQYIRQVLLMVSTQLVDQETPKDGTTVVPEPVSRASKSYDPTKPPGT